MPEIFSGERNPDNGEHHPNLQAEHIKMCKCYSTLLMLSKRVLALSVRVLYVLTGACYLYARSFNPTGGLPDLHECHTCP